jgi:D-alanyl-D-alanine carboxypeptidase (penicillin-binding protein 5/6)
MRSGNDCAHALAMQVGGVKETLAKMNAKAKALGALDTQVATPSGLDGPGMMTSSFDLAVFYREAMKKPIFAEAVSTRQIDMPGYGDKPGFKVSNDNKLLGVYPGFLGGKTGFTDDARHTYLGGAEQGGHRLVVVLMRGEQAPVRMADQGGHLFTWGFGLYKNKISPVGQLSSAKPPAVSTTTAPDGSGGVAGDGTVNTATGVGAKEDANKGPLPTVAMSVSAVTVLGFLIWRVRRRYSRPAEGPNDDPEMTMRIPVIRD